MKDRRPMVSTSESGAARSLLRAIARAALSLPLDPE